MGMSCDVDANARAVQCMAVSCEVDVSARAVKHAHEHGLVALLASLQSIRKGIILALLLLLLPPISSPTVATAGAQPRLIIYLRIRRS
mgnify:CR=1 FL=1